MSNYRKDYVEYRIAKAHEAITDAKLLAEHSGWNSCMNRLYYACFYAASALLLKKGVSSKTHTGLKTQFNLHLVQPGIISKEFGKLYAELMNWRDKGDYSDLVDFTQETVEPLIKPVEEFVSTVEELLKQ